MVVSGCNSTPQIFRNDGGNAANSLALRFEGVASNRDGIGVAVRYVLAGRTVYDQRTGGGSYLSASDTRLHLGLGQAREVRQVEIRWPSGAVDRVEALAAGFIYTIKERSGVLARAAFTRR